MARVVRAAQVVRAVRPRRVAWAAQVARAAQVAQEAQVAQVVRGRGVGAPGGETFRRGRPRTIRFLGMAVDADDDIVVSGYEQGVVGVTNIEPDGNARAIVAKYSPAGTMLWKTTLDTGATDTAEDVAIDPAGGGLVVLGRTSGAFPSFVNQGQFDLFLALLDPTSGQPSTIFQSGNERPQHPARLSLGPGGQVVVGGWDDTYILTNYVAANQDGFFASFSIDPGPAHAIGQTSWLYTYPPSATAPFSNANGVAAEQDGSGASYVVTTVSANPSVSGIFVTKLRGDHTTAWTERISASPFDAVTAVALSPSGELYVTGGTFLTLGARSFGQEDAFVMKLDKETGAPLWTGQGGSADSDYPTALAFDTLGNVAVAGYTLGSVVDGGANQGGADLFALKWSSGGDLVSAWQRGTSVDDLVTSMAADHCGNFFVGGFTGGALVAGEVNAGGEDMFVLRVGF